MSQDVLVSVDHVSKQYFLFNRPQDRLKESLFRHFGKSYARVFWALKDVSFEVKRGEVFGIIGRNGSGKSTLLQIVAGTLQPTSGSVRVSGRTSALLELGAGFNPEFTGRENIYLNGAILGISNVEMKKKVDQIIDFARIGEFIDQPVKFYSSGMYVRLAFAIATSVDPDVLVIDEALAVGDAGFVIKCMNRMRQLCERGTTILLVTHDVQTVRSFCHRAMWLHEGMVQGIGTPLDITSQYVQFLFGAQMVSSTTLSDSLISQVRDVVEFSRTLTSLENRTDLIRWGSGDLQIEAFTMDDGRSMREPLFEYGQRLHVEFVARAMKDIPSEHIGFGISFRDSKGLDIINSTTYERGRRIPPLKAGQQVRLSFDLINYLAPGNYALILNTEDRADGQPKYLDFIENALIFKVISEFPIYSVTLPPVSQNIEVIG